MQVKFHTKYKMINSIITADHHPKRGHNRRRKRKKRKQTGASQPSQTPTACNPGSSLQSSTSPTGNVNGCPKLFASTLEPRPPPPPPHPSTENLIDLKSPEPIPGKSM